MLKTITVKKLLNELSNIQLIDIREPYEVEEGYIQKSINIPIGSLGLKIFTSIALFREININ